MLPALCLSLTLVAAPFDFGGHDTPVASESDVAFDTGLSRLWLGAGLLAWTPLGLLPGIGIASLALRGNPSGSQQLQGYLIGSGVGALVGAATGFMLAWGVWRGSELSRWAIMVPLVLEVLGAATALGLAAKK